MSTAECKDNYMAQTIKNGITPEVGMMPLI